VNITVLQHGVTPLDDLKPAVTIASGEATKTFAATPTSKPGEYRARVVFPTAGRWTYEIDDGFISGQPHTYPAVEIQGTAPAAAATADTGPNLLWLIPGIALLLAAAAILVLPRTRARQHKPQAA